MIKIIFFYLVGAGLIYGAWYLNEHGIGANQDIYQNYHRYGGATGNSIRTGSSVGGYYGGGSVK